MLWGKWLLFVCCSTFLIHTHAHTRTRTHAHTHTHTHQKEEQAEEEKVEREEEGVSSLPPPSHPDLTWEEYINAPAEEWVASENFLHSQLPGYCYSVFCRPPHLGRTMDLKVERKHYRASVCMVRCGIIPTLTVSVWVGLVSLFPHPGWRMSYWNEEVSVWNTHDCHMTVTWLTWWSCDHQMTCMYIVKLAISITMLFSVTILFVTYYHVIVMWS